jgi:hypothetical protein
MEKVLGAIGKEAERASACAILKLIEKRGASLGPTDITFPFSQLQLVFDEASSPWTPEKEKFARTFVFFIQQHLKRTRTLSS